MFAVILAAGAARRMGRQKLLLPIDGRSMVECVVRAAAEWPTVIVAGDEVAPLFGSSSLRIVRNSTPERGMAHSLALANQVIPHDEPIAVLLADMPDVTAAGIAHVIAAYDVEVDVVVARHGEQLMHPVIFGPRARRKICELPDGDTIKRLRDDPNLRRRIVDAPGQPYTDIDTPADYAERISNTA